MTNKKRVEKLEKSKIQEGAIGKKKGIFARQRFSPKCDQRIL